LYITLQIPENEGKRAVYEKQDITGINDDVMTIVKTEHDRLYPSHLLLVSFPPLFPSSLSLSPPPPPFLEK
jgi:hypothetical protein